MKTSDPITFQETKVSSQPIFQGHVLTLRVDQVNIFTGDVRQREVVEHPGGVVALPILPDGRLILIRQYRYAIGQFLIEFPAGKREPKETPFVSIQRELEEETGYIAQQWTKLGEIITSPGFCDEYLHIYKAENLTLSVHPRRDEDEHIQLLTLTPSEVQQMIHRHEILDAKTVCAFALGYGLTPTQDVTKL